MSWILVVTACLWGLDRIGSWMESKGWIYWRKSRGHDSRLGNAFLEVHSLLEPGKKLVLEAKKGGKEK